MDGLVERLRRYANAYRVENGPDSMLGTLLDEAADRIEALETDVVELRSERDLHKSRFENLLMLTSRERDALEAENAELRNAKDGAYSERNKLVAALSKLFPSWLGRTEIEGLEPEWAWCVYVNLPTGQVSWHIHESEMSMFDHLSVGLGPSAQWDGHTTETKYERLAALRSREG